MRCLRAIRNRATLVVHRGQFMDLPINFAGVGVEWGARQIRQVVAT